MIWPISQLLELVKVVRTRFPEPASSRLFDDESIEAMRRMELPGALQPTRDELARKALEIAVAQIGCGETSNNCGPDVERYIAPAKAPANWCAAFAGWCYEQAARELEAPLPFKRSLGAKRLGESVVAVGRRFVEPLEAKPGDLMIFHRGPTGSWMGHVGIVEDVVGRSIATIEGNAGPKVMRRTRWVDRDRFAFFASIRPNP